ncbi:MAG: TlpA family protein disulfide reductase [Paludibacter sp.]|nr:TlpA family protein disulfide reductase [Paludibacter sp.]
MYKHLIIFVSMLCVNFSFAQTISYDMPDFAGRQYWVCAFQGAKTDTLVRGIVPPDGIFTFKMPARYSDYYGILRFGIGSGQWNCIMNNENFTITNRNNVLEFGQSVENNKIFMLQKDFANILNKVDFIYRGLSIYNDNSQLNTDLRNEFANLDKNYSDLYAKMNDCKLYACKYVKMQYFTNGYSQRIFLPEEKMLNYSKLLNFYTDSLSIDELYTSDLYVTTQSVVLNLLNSTAQLGVLMIEKMQQIRSDKVFSAFADDVMTQCQRNSWADAEDMIAQYLVDSKRLDKFSFAYQYSSEVLRGKIGNIAPKIDGVNSLKNTLLFFYESDCPHCMDQIVEFKRYYKQLQSKGIQVISISSDREPSLFEETARTFEWKNKFCDFQGFEGKTFTDYGVRGTPVIFYINDNEKIIGRYAHLSETKLIE